MKNIAIIPARSGSKGLKDKNIKPLLDIPLLAYSIRAAKDSALFDEIMVSTDSDDYAQIATMVLLFLFCALLKPAVIPPAAGML